MYAKILVPIDGSETSERGMREAIGLARQLTSRLVLLYIVDPYPQLGDTASAGMFEDSRRHLLRFGERTLDNARKSASESGVSSEAVLCEASTGCAAEVIVDEAARHGCQLIVMGTHGRRGLNRLLLGSDAELVLRLAEVPVLLVRKGEAEL
jgi:nucleotide-binding universal stress UspA family protein